MESVTLNPFRSGRRQQELVFELAKDLTRGLVAQSFCAAPAHVIFPQLALIVDRYLATKVQPVHPAKLLDVFCSPYYGWAIERLIEAIRPDTTEGEAPELPILETSRGPGSTQDVDFWTGRDVREVNRSHVNFVVADTKQWEQAAAYFIDTHRAVEAVVKNAGLGFAIPYLDNGEHHDYLPDFIVRLTGGSARHVIVETKGYDPLGDVKTAAAKRWVAAVNADGRFGSWSYAIVKRPSDVVAVLDKIAA